MAGVGRFGADGLAFARGVVVVRDDFGFGAARGALGVPAAPRTGLALPLAGSASLSEAPAGAAPEVAGSPALAGERLPLRRCGRVLGSDPITPG